MDKSNVITLSAADKKESISFIVPSGASTELLRIAPDGFYVRGVKLEQDENEARAVYEAFAEWVKWANKGLKPSEAP